MNTENLKHNIAGELASLYVNYLAKYYIQKPGVDRTKYFKDNWNAEYKSRIKQMEERPELIETLNGYNEFYKLHLKESGEVRRKFLLQN